MPRFEFDASDEIVMLALLRIYFGWDEACERRANL